MHEGYLRWPEKMRNPPNDKSRYCDFHQEYGHDTDAYFNLKREFDDLAKRGYLKKYIQD
ncbi:hypothetical protein L8N14_015260 [Serratia marcescens]